MAITLTAPHRTIAHAEQPPEPSHAAVPQAEHLRASMQMRDPHVFWEKRAGDKSSRQWIGCKEFLLIPDMSLLH